MSKVTIVSCFYVLPRPKHSMGEYMRWIQNFLTFVDTPIVMFSDGEVLDYLRQMRDEAGLSERLCLIQKPFETLKFSSSEWIQIWEDQVSKSSYSHLHNQELFRVWSNKAFFVEEAIEKNPFQSDYFVWCDAGCWRDELAARICGPSWPLPEKIIPKRLHILAMSPVQPWLEKLEAFPKEISQKMLVEQLNTSNTLTIGGTILIGDKAAWQAWIPIFETTLKIFVELGRFAGDDQAVIMSTALFLYKANSENKPVFFKSPSKNGFVMVSGFPIGDAWFAFQQHFSQIGFSLDLA